MSDAHKKTGGDTSQGHYPKCLGSFSSNPKTRKETSDVTALERKTMRYVDWRILPLLAVLYSCALIDRTNLASAYVSGMAIDLKLTTGARYSILSSSFYIPVALLIPLAGILILKKIGPRYWATFVIVGWGAIEVGMAFATTWGYLCFCRIILGVLEASFFPGLIYIISIWYTRHEVQKRISLFYLISVVIASFSPMFAYACSLLDGKRGLRGWQWIFIIEGSITFFLAIIAWFFMPHFPHKNTFLTSEQTELVLKRVDDDRGDALPDPVTLRNIKLHLSDWTLWAYGFMYMFVYLPNIALAYFTPIILKGMGFSQTKVLLLSCPPFIPAFFSVMFFSYLSDKYKHRSSFIVLQAMICATGLTITAFTTGHAVRYLGVVLIAMGGCGTTPGVFVYSANNVVSHSKRTIQTALTVCLGGIGGIIGTNVFRQQDYPRFIPGLSVTIGAQILLSILIGITTIHFRRLNRQMREGKREQPLEGQPGFYYTL